MSDWAPHIAAAGLALLVLALLRLLLPLWPGFVALLAGARDQRRVTRRAAGPGALLRACLTLAVFFEPWARRLPEPWQRQLALRLERAGLGGSGPPSLWLALPAAIAAVAVPVLGLLATTLGLGWLVAVPISVGLALWWPSAELLTRARARQALAQRDLPGYLEMITLGLEAGAAFPAALQMAMARAPGGPLREEFARVLQELRAGHARREALQRLDQRLGVASLSATVAAIVQAEATGVSLAPVLRAQAHRGTQERFARAEKRAMEAPVKMLGPLILCIFPCTFIVVGFPIAAMLFWGA